MVRESKIKWYERSRPDDGHVEEVYLKSVTEKQLTEINVGDWLEGFGDVNSLAVQKFIRKYGQLLFKLKDNSEWDGTDFAHPAFFRGSLYSAHQAVRLIEGVLSGKDIGAGAMNEPAVTIRNLVLDLKRKFDMFEKENQRLIEELHLANGKLSSNGIFY